MGMAAAAPPYRVSTITCNGHIGAVVCLATFFRHIALAGAGAAGFVWAQRRLSKAEVAASGLSDDAGERIETRGVYPKPRRAGKGGRTFDNQVTVVYRFQEAYMPSVKLFQNGSVQMTGVRTLEDGRAIVAQLAAEVRRIAREDAAGVVADPAAVGSGDFTVRMMNCDFVVPFLVRRKDLHNMLIAPPYGLLSSFQPGTYPGVKVQYFYRASEGGGKHAGRCRCPVQCAGSGAGGECKKVTLAIFESGKILITGATAYAQLDEAHAFIRTLLLDNQARLMKVLLPPPPVEAVAAEVATTEATAQPKKRGLRRLTAPLAG